MHGNLPREGWLWTALLAGPLAAQLELFVVYALAQRSCAQGTRVWLHLAAAVCFVVAAAGWLAAWHGWKAHGARGSDARDADRRTHLRFLSSLGVQSGALFLLLVAAQWAAVATLGPCPW